jgi:hypothetical protein
MNPPPSPSLLEVIRLLLQRVEGSSYPNQDPTSIEDLKAHLRCRIAELQAAEEEELFLPEEAKRVPSRNPHPWQQATGRQSRSPAVPDFRVQMETGRFGRTGRRISDKLQNLIISQPRTVNGVRDGRSANLPLSQQAQREWFARFNLHFLFCQRCLG